MLNSPFYLELYIIAKLLWYEYPSIDFQTIYYYDLHFMLLYSYSRKVMNKEMAKGFGLNGFFFNLIEKFRDTGP